VYRTYFGASSLSLSLSTASTIQHYGAECLEKVTFSWSMGEERAAKEVLLERTDIFAHFKTRHARKG